MAIDATFIARDVRRHLPEVEEDVAEAIGAKLFESGLRHKNRLRLVKQADFEGHLLPFDARTLIDEWSKTSDDQQDASALSNSTTDQGNSSTRSTETAATRTGIFKVDWTDLYKISNSLTKRLETGRKLTRRMKRQLVARIVNQVRNKVPHATRAIFNNVTPQLKNKYPATFSSELAKGQVNKGSLTKMMKDKFDNDKRPRRKTTTEREAPARKEAYGCIKWRLASLPDGETWETQEEKRQELSDYYEGTRPRAWDLNYIQNKMKATYGSLRQEINKQAEDIERKQREAKKKGKKSRDNREEEDAEDDVIVTTHAIRERWPFLFWAPVMTEHFKILTGVDIEAQFEQILVKDGKSILKFMMDSAKKKKKTKRMLKQAEEANPNSKVPQLTAILLMMLQRFKEDPQSIWIIVEDWMREDDIDTLTLPKTPVLVCAGEHIFDVCKVYLAMDQTILGSVPNVMDGMKMLFASYYVFNLTYAAGAQVTLEFIQRVIAEMNPERGHKRPKKEEGGRHSTRMIHPALVHWNDKYDLFKAAEQESSESETTD